VDVFNLGFDSLQALLDVDSVSGASEPLSLLTQVPLQGIAAAAATLVFEFDTTAAKIGSYNQQLALHVSDENLPGESTSQLQLTLAITVGDVEPCAGDITGDGAVDVDDLLMVINAWGVCVDPKDCPADVAVSGAVDVDDLLIVINGWGMCQ
jgi:hypothetical protein